jgi:hypothetical protein
MIIPAETDRKIGEEGVRAIPFVKGGLPSHCCVKPKTKSDPAPHTSTAPTTYLSRPAPKS